jgi:hypothetical protein
MALTKLHTSLLFLLGRLALPNVGFLHLQTIGHEILDSPTIVPIIVEIDVDLRNGIRVGQDLYVVISRQVSFAGDVSEEMRDIAEVLCFWTDAALESICWQLEWWHAIAVVRSERGEAQYEKEVESESESDLGKQT